MVKLNTYIPTYAVRTFPSYHNDVQVGLANSYKQSTHIYKQCGEGALFYNLKWLNFLIRKRNKSAKDRL